MKMKQQVIFVVSCVIFIIICEVSSAVPLKWEVASDAVDEFFVPENDIIYRLCTREIPRNCPQIQWNDMNSVRNSHFNPNNPTVITIHGWNGDETSAVNWRVNERYLAIGEYNMINVDWSVGAGTINYITARNRVAPVGVIVAQFIDNLHAENFIRFNELSVVGTSLGAHVAGIAGKSVTRGRISYIVGLDPAGPLFNFNDASSRLDAADAIYVEIIHTNSGQLGIREPIGDADFYPNFGSSQPGCDNDLTGNCAHGRAINLFSESITDIFTSAQCNSFDEITNNVCTPTGLTARMGGPSPKIGLNGIFFLTTNSQSPFSQG